MVLMYLHGLRLNADYPDSLKLPNQVSWVQ